MCVCMSSPDQNIILEHGSIHHFKTGATTRDRSIDQFVVVLVAAVFKRGDDTTVKTLDYKRKVARNLRKKPTKKWFEYAEWQILESRTRWVRWIQHFQHIQAHDLPAANVHLALLLFMSMVRFDGRLHNVVKFDSGFRFICSNAITCIFVSKRTFNVKIEYVLWIYIYWAPSLSVFFCLKTGLLFSAYCDKFVRRINCLTGG